MDGLGRSVYAGGLFAVLGVLAWLTGQPLVFPSLGPTAFLFAFEGVPNHTRRRVVGGHAIGALAGLLAHLLLASGLVLSAGEPSLSVEWIRLGASGTVAVALTAWGMAATDTVHAPACATTLIVSLGLLAAPIHVVGIVASVVVLTETHLAVSTRLPV